AGLTNMLLCPAGARIVEMADLSFPNPNFYAMASALGHRYWIIEAEAVGAGHPLRRDMRVDPARLAAHPHAVPDGAGGAAAPAERDGSGSLHQAGAGAAP